MQRLCDDHQTTVSFEFLDAKGQPTGAENIRLESSDPDVVRVDDIGGDQFLCVAGRVGTCQLQCTADARVGEGEKLLTGAETVEVVPGEAEVVRMVFGESVPQPT